MAGSGDVVIGVSPTVAIVISKIGEPDVVLEEYKSSSGPAQSSVFMPV